MSAYYNRCTADAETAAGNNNGGAKDKTGRQRSSHSGARTTIL